MQLRLVPGLVFCLLTAACTHNQIRHRTNLTDFPLKIGIIADSQITTDKERYQNESFRSPRADRYAPVSIRPPALEYLAPTLLDHLLAKLTAEKVDLILYLGDAANSGCRDELETVFSSLRAISGGDNPIPTYFVIGNHDYLGTGNQTLRSARTDLCQRGDVTNPAVDKYELIRMANSLNSASAQIDSNFDYRFIEEKPAVQEMDGACDNSHYYSSNAAILKPEIGSGLSIDIMLADTSDYNNVWFRPKFGKCSSLELWGLKGSMSYEQIRNLQMLGCQHGSDCDIEGSFKENRNPQFGIDYRFVASHYDPKAFNAATPWNWSPSFVRDNLGYLLSDGENIWLGAHHHSEKPRTDEYEVGKSILRGPSGTFSALSVGSTTDYNPHAAIIESRSKSNMALTDKLGYREISIDTDTGFCENLIAFADRHIDMFEPVCADTLSDELSALGVNPIYTEKSCWNEQTINTVRANVDKLIEMQTPEDTELSRLCLALKASEIEKNR